MMTVTAVIRQRVHERDVARLILSDGRGDEHLNLRMEFDAERRCSTSIGWTDPRTAEGELAWPERFTRDDVDRLKKQLRSWGGEYAVASQLQQRPVPRGGGLFQRTWLERVGAAPAGG